MPGCTCIVQTILFGSSLNIESLENKGFAIYFPLARLFVDISIVMVLNDRIITYRGARIGK